MLFKLGVTLEVLFTTQCLDLVQYIFVVYFKIFQNVKHIGMKSFK